MRMTTTPASDLRAQARPTRGRARARAWILGAVGGLARWLARAERRAAQDRARRAYGKMTVHCLREIGPIAPGR